jgi:hypothetical protein
MKHQSDLGGKKISPITSKDFSIFLSFLFFFFFFFGGGGGKRTMNLLS